MFRRDKVFGAASLLWFAAPTWLALTNGCTSPFEDCSSTRTCARSAGEDASDGRDARAGSAKGGAGMAGRAGTGGSVGAGGYAMAGAGGAQNAGTTTDDAGAKDAGPDGEDSIDGATDGEAEGGGPPAIYVSALNGNDSNAGDYNHPLKTLRKALSIATRMQVVRLFSGTYDAVNGEDFVAPVPDSVSIEAVSAGEAVLDGQGLTEPALTLAGNSTIRNLKFQNFASALVASFGKVELSGLNMVSNNIGLDLHGSVSVIGKQIEISGGYIGVRLWESPKFDLYDSRIENVGQPCAGGAAGVSADYSAEAVLHSVTITGSIGDAVSLRRAANVTLQDCTLSKNGNVGCGGSSIEAGDSSVLRMIDTVVESPNDVGSFMIEVYNLADITNGRIGGARTGTAIDGLTNSSISITGTEVFGSRNGIWSTGSVKVDGAKFSGNRDHMYLQGYAKVRNTTFLSDGITNDHAIYLIDGASGLDLGTQADLGHNTIQDKSGYGLRVDVAVGTINAVGNTWKASAQGADASGAYAIGSKVVGPACPDPSEPSNFCIPSGTTLQF